MGHFTSRLVRVRPQGRVRGVVMAVMCVLVVVGLDILKEKGRCVVRFWCFCKVMLLRFVTRCGESHLMSSSCAAYYMSR